MSFGKMNNHKDVRDFLRTSILGVTMTKLLGRLSFFSFI